MLGSSQSGRWARIATALVLATLALPTLDAGGQDRTDLLAYGSSGWLWELDPPAEPAPLTFVPSGLGTAPFALQVFCNLPPPGTTWPANTELEVAHIVTVPDGASNVVVHFVVDNDLVSLSWNGQQIRGLTVHEECPLFDDFSATVPADLVLPVNLLQARARDRGGATFFDARVSAVVP